MNCSKLNLFSHLSLYPSSSLSSKKCFIFLRWKFPIFYKVYLYSLLLSQGVQPKVISERLGHSNINITKDLYSHIYEATNVEVANNFDKFLKIS